METTKFTEIIDTLPQIKDQPQPCGDCGLLVKNRVVHYAVYDMARNPHWRKKCLECGENVRISHPFKTP